MGILYKEMAEYKYQKAKKLVLILVSLTILIDLIFIFSSYGRLFEDIIFLGYGIIPVSMAGFIFLWAKCRKRYRYTIIDNELIIERFIGNKRKTVMNLNAKSIVKLESIYTRSKEENLAEEYYFLCTGRRKSIYCCLFVKDGKTSRFYFEPSIELLSKLNLLLGKRQIA